jgi:hypothetical protein
MRGLLAVIVCLAGCGDGLDAQVVLATGPMAIIGEGDRLEIPVTIEPVPDSLGLLVPSTFVVEADEGVADLFAELAIEMGTAGPVLVARPLCSMVRPGEGNALVSLVVRTEPTDLATSASVTLQVTQGNTESCAPLVQTWLPGDPSSPCDLASDRSLGSRLDLPIGTSPPLCMEVISLDPEQERLWLRTDSDAPETLLVPPSADDFVRQIFEVAIADTDDFRGEFPLRHRVFVGDPGQGGELRQDGMTTLVIGQPG